MKASLQIENKETTDNNQVNLKIYQYLTEKFIYLACGTKPDISFVVEYLSRYNSDLWIIYIYIVKSIL